MILNNFFLIFNKQNIFDIKTKKYRTKYIAYILFPVLIILYKNFIFIKLWYLFGFLRYMRGGHAIFTSGLFIFCMRGWEGFGAGFHVGFAG